MASNSIFRSFTLPNGKEMRTMREDVRNTALQAVKDRKGPASGSRKASTTVSSHSERLKSPSR